MNFINMLERKFGRFAIKNLMLYIIILYAIGFVIELVAPEFFIQYLILNPAAICHGQIWRIFTFLMTPPNTSLIFIIFALYLYYMLGTALERTWGTFRFNLYFFTGAALTVIVGILAYLIAGQNLYDLGTFYINMSLFLAFATVYPDMQLLLFFIIPVKVKWLALIDVVYFGYIIVTGFMKGSIGGYVDSIAAFVALGNFLIFFFATRNMSKYNPKQMHRKKQYKKEVNLGRQNVVVHRCHTCGRTSLDHPELTFRYCSKCDGNFEYCEDHIFTHEHVKNDYVKK